MPGVPLNPAEIPMSVWNYALGAVIAYGGVWASRDYRGAVYYHSVALTLITVPVLLLIAIGSTTFATLGIVWLIWAVIGAYLHFTTDAAGFYTGPGSDRL